MRAINKRIWAANEHLHDKTKKTTMHAADGVHLNDLGQMAMAFAILKGLGAPADVSSVAIDLSGEPKIEVRGCRVSDLKREGDLLQFDRLDEGLPINFGLFGALNFRFVPIPEQLNRYMLAVKNLPPGKYEVLADDRMLTAHTHEQLARGVNISSVTSDAWQPGGPWDVQSTIVKSLTEARGDLWLSTVQANAYLTDPQRLAELSADAARINAQLEDLQRAAARPRPYHFVVRKAAEQ